MHNDEGNDDYYDGIDNDKEDGDHDDDDDGEGY